MSFRGCSHRLGCTVLLKGASAEQLAAIKNITRVGLALSANLQAKLQIPYQAKHQM